ncbi:N-methyl-L-tryptophan oxidase [Halogeometricum luteum]|uniref:N-methyl-L-tryptophan oxidase n=1 Tax=Halogeometricum luteum TaxID=2950537 RepID=A0ABU2G5P5_9EURY|nr:N-methyl-L-tryptophan oxidase [Halogeometricum sp. S3BR5-2]MDS0295478.1 N-methyl-L-tryptophan oxidase [Halogeometricum sp. S3BR5-2]
MTAEEGSKYDAIVVGVGGVGSAVVYELARRGKNVLGLERYDIPHSRGSSHGQTRIIRRAYHEHPQYMAMIDRAYDYWERLEDECGEQLLFKTGSVAAGPAASDLVSGARRTCEVHSIPHERIGGAEASERFPGFTLPEEYEVVYQADGGFVRPEAATVAHVRLARELGATVETETEVTDWRSTRNGVQVTTENGRYEADRLVVAAGPWLGKVVDSLASAVSPERQVLSWFRPKRAEDFAPETHPVFLVSDGEDIHYGFPTYGRPGVKFGRHYHLRERIDPDGMDREATAHDEAILAEAAGRYLAVDADEPLGFETCIYTNTADRDFIVDTLPNHSDVVVLGGFSGHGYKFAGVLGELGAELASGEEPSLDIGPFAIGR